MAKKTKNDSSFSHFSDLWGISDEWKEIWENVAAESQKTMAQALQNFSIPSFPGIGNAVFNPKS